jgi:signal transduction histidine kinase
MGFQLLKKDLTDLDETYKVRIDKLSQVIDESASDVRTISHQMMPKSLKQVGLAPAMRDMLDKSLGSCDISYDFDELNPTGRMAASLELSLYRIAQEVVNNIIKHSKAEHVDIQLYKSKGHVVLNIEDDGVGFNSDSDTDGHGMLNIQNRSRLIDGQLEVDSHEGKGTSVRLRVPFREA